MPKKGWYCLKRFRVMYLTYRNGARDDFFW